MMTEFIWSIERQVRLGMRIPAQRTTKLACQIALVVADRRHPAIASLLDLPRAEWTLAISAARTRAGTPLAPHQLAVVATTLGRILDLLVHAYYRGEWWQLDIWNLVLDNRIALRKHEPLRHSAVCFGKLATDWLRNGAKFFFYVKL